MTCKRCGIAIPARRQHGRVQEFDRTCVMCEQIALLEVWAAFYCRLMDRSERERKQ